MNLPPHFLSPYELTSSFSVIVIQIDSIIDHLMNLPPHFLSSYELTRPSIILRILIFYSLSMNIFLKIFSNVISLDSSSYWNLYHHKIVRIKPNIFSCIITHHLSCLCIQLCIVYIFPGSSYSYPYIKQILYLFLGSLYCQPFVNNVIIYSRKLAQLLTKNFL